MSDFLIDENIIRNTVGKDVKGVIHIGAHFGQEHDFYESVGAKNILYFECHPQTYEKLLVSVGDKPNTVCVKKALGDESGVTKTMYCATANTGASNSLLKPNAHEQIYPDIKFDNTVEVEQITLDEYGKEHDLSEYNFMNVDVQGYEMHVYKGAIETLKNIKWIVTEINFAEMYSGCAKFKEIDEFLREQGFVLKTGIDTRCGWGDAFYERQETSGPVGVTP